MAYCRQFITEWNACDVDDQTAALEEAREWEEAGFDDDSRDEAEPSECVGGEK